MIYSGKSGDTSIERHSATKYNHTSQRGLALITLLWAVASACTEKRWILAHMQTPVSYHMLPCVLIAGFL